MKRILFSLCLLGMLAPGLRAQEKYGKTLNVGAGLGYYGYFYTAPAVTLNYEFDVFRNFTLAPFLSYSTYKNRRYWGDGANPYRDYTYRETSIPVGLKASYYFDELFEAGDNWDFYFAGSLGFAFRTVTWEAGYKGQDKVYAYSSPLFGTLHIGTEYHFSDRVGLFLDVATGYTTLGLGIHF